MATKSVQVPNIGCDGCVRTIQNELKDLPGVQRVDGDVDSQTVTVEWDAPATWATITTRLAEIDYAPADA